MLLDAILTVLRETLEAGVLVSLLTTVSRERGLSPHWLTAALPAGLLTALLYAGNLSSVSGSFDGVGQELLNAALQYAIAAALLVLLGLLARRDAVPAPALQICMALAVICAVAREGAEILLFFSSYLQADEALTRAITSGFVGLAVGLSVGVMTFFALLAMPARLRRPVQITLLSAVCAGMALQATQMLIQADWLSAGAPLWNSNDVLDEHAMLGQMAYAVFGYEATPNALEIGAYVSALVLIALAHCRRAP